MLSWKKKTDSKCYHGKKTHSMRYHSTILLAKEKAWFRLAGLRLKHYDFPINNFVESAASGRRRRYACTLSFQCTFILFSPFAVS